MPCVDLQTLDFLTACGGTVCGLPLCCATVHVELRGGVGGGLEERNRSGEVRRADGPEEGILVLLCAANNGRAAALVKVNLTWVKPETKRGARALREVSACIQQLENTRIFGCKNK